MLVTLNLVNLRILKMIPGKGQKGSSLLNSACRTIVKTGIWVLVPA